MRNIKAELVVNYLSDVLGYIDYDFENYNIWELKQIMSGKDWAECLEYNNATDERM